MRILFVYANVTRLKSPQIGISMLAAVADQLGHECGLYDLTTVSPGKEVSAFQAKVNRFEPDVLAVSCRSNEWKCIVQLINSVKMENVLTVFGGPHATVAPDEVINCGDIVVLGEGESIFANILKKLAEGDDITTVDGCWVRKGNRVIKNGMFDLIPHLDELPLPNWKIFDDTHYYDSYVKERFEGAGVIGTFEMSRGCPYSCTYCNNDYVRNLYKGKGKWRREKSPERIVQEVTRFRDQYGLDAVSFIDEILLANTERLEKFSNLYQNEVGVPFVFMERPENMTDEKVNLITRAGAQMVSIGIESGDEEIRKNLLQRNYSQDTVKNAFDTAKKYGLTTHGFTMIGFPGEDRGSHKKSFALLKEIQPDTVQTTIFYPLKKTKLYEKVVGEGLFDPATPMPHNYYSDSSLLVTESEKRDIKRGQYLLNFYNSRLFSVRFFELAQRSTFFFMLFLPLAAIRKLKNEGLAATVKAAYRRLKK